MSVKKKWCKKNQSFQVKTSNTIGDFSPNKGLTQLFIYEYSSLDFTDLHMSSVAKRTNEMQDFIS